MRSVLADLRHAFRIYLRTPVASALAVVVLAVAMAFVTAFLSMYVDVGIKGHPGFEDSSRLVTIGQTDGRQLAGLPVSVMDLMAEDIRSIDAVGGVILNTLPAIEEGQTPLAMELVTVDYFPGLRPKLQEGRGLESADHETGAANVVVISHRYWRDVLGGADAVGTTVKIDFQSVLGAAQALGGAAAAVAAPADDDDTEFLIVGIMAP